MFPTADGGSASVEHPGWNAHASKAKKNTTIRRRGGIVLDTSSTVRILSEIGRRAVTGDAENRQSITSEQNELRRARDLDMRYNRFKYGEDVSDIVRLREISGLLVASGTM